METEASPSVWFAGHNPHTDVEVCFGEGDKDCSVDFSQRHLALEISWQSEVNIPTKEREVEVRSGLQDVFSPLDVELSDFDVGQVGLYVDSSDGGWLIDGSSDLVVEDLLCDEWPHSVGQKLVDNIIGNTSHHFRYGTLRNSQ